MTGKWFMIEDVSERHKYEASATNWEKTKLVGTLAVTDANETLISFDLHFRRSHNLKKELCNNSYLIVRIQHQLRSHFLVKFLSSQKSKFNSRSFQCRSFFVRFLGTFRNI